MKDKSKHIENNFRDSVVPHDMDLFKMQFEQGMMMGESSGIKEIDNIYTDMPGFLYCHTGWPNSGKTKATGFLKLVSAIKKKRKTVIFSPEEISTVKVDGKIIKSSANIYNEFVHMLTGKVPYKHWKERYGKPQMAIDEYMHAMEIVGKHIMVIDPQDKHYKNLIDTLRWAYEDFGSHDVIIDPWKNVILDETGRGDRDLDYAFTDLKRFAMETQQGVHLVAHGKFDKAPRNQDGSYKICDQHSLLGGSSWYNNMDVLISWYRPFAHLLHTDPDYSMVRMINLKQRDEHLTNRKGEYDQIEFDFLKNRYYFDGVCPIDGEKKHAKQSGIAFEDTWRQPTTTTKDTPF